MKGHAVMLEGQITELQLSVSFKLKKVGHVKC